MICLTSARGRLFWIFHCYKHAHIVIACCAYCLFLISLYFCFCSCLLFIFACMYFFSFDAIILVNKDVHIIVAIAALTAYMWPLQSGCLLSLKVLVERESWVKLRFWESRVTEIGSEAAHILQWSDRQGRGAPSYKFNNNLQLMQTHIVSAYQITTHSKTELLWLKYLISYLFKNFGAHIRYK